MREERDEVPEIAASEEASSIPLALAGDDRNLLVTLEAFLSRASPAGPCRILDGWLREPADPLPAATVFLPSRDPFSGEAMGAAVAAAKGWAAAGLEQLILVSSAQANEPSHRHAGMLSEARLRTSKPGNAIAARWLELEERLLRAVEGTATVITVLRPAALPIPGGRDIFTRRLSGSWAAALPGFNPPLQLLHPEDLAAAVVAAAEARRPGTFNVVPRGVIPLRGALRRGGLKRVPLPAFLHPRGRGSKVSGAAEAAYLRYPWTVCGGKIRRELGFEPRHGSTDTLRWLRPAAQRDPEQASDFDPFGMDRDYVRRLGRTLFRFLHDRYWRIEWQGSEHVPRQGRAVLTGIHRGHQPWDGVMLLHHLVQELDRFPRFLIHPALVKYPFLAPYMRGCGGILACRENGARVLEEDELLGIFPEGIRGAFAAYRDAYRLHSFGRHDYVQFALCHRAPIVPFVTIGSAEIFPILAKLRWRWWQRASEWPCLPITPTFSLLPLPSKWHTVFLPPVPVHEQFPPEAAKDSKTVAAISGRIQSLMQATLDDLRSRRRSIFWGSIFEGEAPRRARQAGDHEP